MPSLIDNPVARKGKNRKGKSVEVPTAGTPILKTHFKVQVRFYKAGANCRHSRWPHNEYGGKRDRYEKLPEK
ncbi:hypothetical protein [Chitinophaga filiformis]|uniref:Uncharacterized protein n=1 Tax=Chitinophaga filiformis TaxID=104663 RepID=A0A1G8B5B7_CHIFI|nr:hypothetical protein [Chitinophaga filiformis]SDH28334.1 hypothetical protein SAMN04488121_110133 [Chitinophaga filiformis]